MKHDPGNAQPPSEGWLYPSLYSERLDELDACEDDLSDQDVPGEDD